MPNKLSTKVVISNSTCSRAWLLPFLSYKPKISTILLSLNKTSGFVRFQTLTTDLRAWQIIFELWRSSVSSSFAPFCSDYIFFLLSICSLLFLSTWTVRSLILVFHLRRTSTMDTIFLKWTLAFREVASFFIFSSSSFTLGVEEILTILSMKDVNWVKFVSKAE